jgi:NADPH-dependent glutamate synthase beta subunit-like oxidoreductase
VIVGGEGLAGEALAKARSLGAETVTFIFRDSPDNAAVSALTEAGATVISNAGVTHLFGDGESLTGVDVLNVDTGETRRIDAQTLVFSSGRFPELIFTRPIGGDDTDDRPGAWTAVPPYKQPDHADDAGLFAKGDALTDFSGAIKAIGAGRRAAATIHRLIYDIPLDLPENVLRPDVAIQNVDHVEAVATSQRRIMPLADSRDLAQLMELEKGFDTAAAQTEASRCLNCGLICYQNAENQRSLEQIGDAVNA